MPPTNLPPLPPKPTVEKVEEELDDPVDAVIPVGAPCLRNGCKVSYVDHSSRTEKCIYHPGIPLFHEGSKGWTCCKPKVLDFSDFLKIEGCQEGKHKFVKKKTVIKFKSIAIFLKNKIIIFLKKNTRTKN